MVAVLFVCLGNIYRSPAAEGILRHLAKKTGIELYIESCGVEACVGQLADQRMRKALEKRGIILEGRGKQFDPVYLEAFDYILATDNTILSFLKNYAQNDEQKRKIHLITHYSSLYQGLDIPDPFYHGEDMLNYVVNMLEDSCSGLLDNIINNRG